LLKWSSWLLEVQALGEGWLRRRRGLCTETRRQFGHLALPILDGPGVSLQAHLHGLSALLLHGDRDQAMVVIQRKIAG